MAGKMNSLAMYPVNTHSKPYVNGAQNAHVSTGAVAIAPAGRTQARALVLVPTKLNCGLFICLRERQNDT